MRHAFSHPIIGRPDDMVSRGPRYPWVDFDAMDAEVEDMELILTTIFPDRVVRQFFLDVGSSFLRRRNRYKHFYVFTTRNDHVEIIMFIQNSRKHERWEESFVQSHAACLR